MGRQVEIYFQDARASLKTPEQECSQTRKGLAPGNKSDQGLLALVSIFTRATISFVLLVSLSNGFLSLSIHIAKHRKPRTTKFTVHANRTENLIGSPRTPSLNSGKENLIGPA